MIHKFLFLYFGFNNNRFTSIKAAKLEITDNMSEKQNTELCWQNMDTGTAAC